MDLQLLQLLVNGIAVGSIIALAAVGLTLTYGILRLANFAHGDLLTLGAYLALTVNSPNTLGLTNLPPVNIWISILIGAVLTIGVTLLTEKFIWAPMRERRASATTLIIISIGLALFLRNGIILIWGAANQRYNLPVVPALNLLGLKVPQNRLVVFLLAVLVIVALHCLLQYTKTGKAMRAVADNVDLARVSGISVERVVVWTWVIAAGLTAVGGGMYGIVTAVRPTMGWLQILPMFAAVILGGIGNPYGAIAGAFVIGIAQEVSTYWISTEYKLGVALLIMIIVLLFRPQGIFRGTF